MDKANGKDVRGWKFLKILGRGDFGQVSLWYNTLTGEKIALKKLLENAPKDASIKSKLIEKWSKEVETMDKLHHANIVSTTQIPDQLKVVEPFPVLAMEYCSKGDLRQVLEKSENCCGLCEPEILSILKDISNGLAYLHSCKIIHRDIKPDNIVLQQKGKSTIYKLIDLGYAKGFDQNSLSRSFVETIQYIAPEIFLGKKYSSTVDYWSFGLTTHEIITGYRPFLHNFHPSDWMRRINSKSRSIISVVECANGEIVFSSKISRKNHLTRGFLDDIEKWLQVALDWDGQSRGRDLERNRLVIFELLADIICKKLIKVFSLPTYDILSYEITNATDISDLRKWLKRDTDLEEDDQLLLLPSGKSLNAKGNLLKNIEFQEIDRSGVSIFLYNSGVIVLKNAAGEITNFISELKKLTNGVLSPRQLQKFCSDTVYFLQHQGILYRNFLQGIKIKIDNTKQKTLALESFFEDLENEWSRIDNYGNFLILSHKTDLERYIYYRKEGKLKTSPLVRKWIENVINMNSKISELKNSFNKTKQRQLVLLAKKHCQNLEDHSNIDMVRPTPLDGLIEKGENLWENIQKLSKLQKNVEVQTTLINAVKLLDKSVEETNLFLKNENLKVLFIKISEADENLSKFHLHLTNIHKSMNFLKLMIQHIQAERQKEVWNIVTNLEWFSGQQNQSKICAENDTSEAFLGSLDEEVSSEKGVSNLSFKSDSDAFSMSIQNQESAHLIIEHNNRLRHRMQETQETSDAMVREMSSLNWDFLVEI